MVNDPLKIRWQVAILSIFLLVPAYARAGEKTSKNILVFPSNGQFDEGRYRKLCSKQYEDDSVSYCVERYRQLASSARASIESKKKARAAIKQRLLSLGYDPQTFKEAFGKAGKTKYDKLASAMKEKEKSAPLLEELDAETEFLGQMEVTILRQRLLKRLVKLPVPTVTPEDMRALSGAAEDSISLRGRFIDSTDAEVFFAYNLFLNPGSNAIESPEYENRVLSNQALAFKLSLMRAASGKDTLQSLEAALDSALGLQSAARDLVFGWNLLFIASAEQIGYLAADYFESYWENIEKNPPSDGKAPARIPSTSFRKKFESVLTAFEAYHKTDSGGYRALMRVLSDPRGFAPEK